jgi:hypothetical protein
MPQARSEDHFALRIIWPVDRGAECERGERAHAGHGHQVSARGLDADLIEHPLREPGDFTRHGLDDRQQ